MIHHPGQLAGYWPQAADDLAWAEGYPTVSACEQAIACGNPGPCHSGLKGFADYGIAEWHDDRIAAINGKTVLGADDFLLEDAVFLGAKHLYRLDGTKYWAGGVCGLEVEPANAILIPYRDIVAMREEDKSRRLVLTLVDGEQTAIPVSPVTGPFDWRPRAARRHDHVQRIIETVETHR